MGKIKRPFLCSEYEIRRSNNYIEIMKPLENMIQKKFINGSIKLI